jgi:DNA-binding response OmpR family regulator
MKYLRVFYASAFSFLAILDQPRGVHMPINLEIILRTEVLIAESDAELRSAYEHRFAESGIHVETAVDGLDCWTKLRACTPDALMLDIDILWGGSDGVLTRLREDPSRENDPEVFVTGNDSPEILSRRVGIAVERCFQKPIEVDSVLNSICDVFAADAEPFLSTVRV